MKRFSRSFFQSIEKIVLFLTIGMAVAAFVFGVSARSGDAAVDEAPSSDIVSFHQVSPLPTSTFTPSPAAPTDTPTPTQLPPTATDTPTPTQLPPTPTDTATPTQLPPTPTDTATPTQLPPTPTDTPVPPNTPPDITAIIGPFEPVAVGVEVGIVVSFDDPDVGDTHNADINWGDATNSALIDVTSPFTVKHTYASPGIFEVVVTVTDLAGASDMDSFKTIIVYDPNGGFVTGGGWIDSPAGAYKPDPSLTGKATFGFVSKYKKGASVPIGNALFQFQTAGLNFHSDKFQWLVVTQNDSTAQIKGVGTINGQLAPNGHFYGFMMWATDSDPDTFRTKIWYEESGGDVTIYDNGLGQPIGGGSIVIHKPK